MPNVPSDLANISNERLRALVNKQIATQVAAVRQSVLCEELSAIANSFAWDQVREAARDRLQELKNPPAELLRLSA